MEAARKVGVLGPERIRVLVVENIPIPEEPLLVQAAQSTGLLGPNTWGLTLGHSIFLLKGKVTLRLLSHEFRHVFQYELFGSIDEFLPTYLHQVATLGYRDAPLEADARRHELLPV